MEDICEIEIATKSRLTALFSHCVHMKKTRRFERIGSMEEFVYRGLAFAIKFYAEIPLLVPHSTPTTKQLTAVENKEKDGQTGERKWKKQSLRNGSDILETISQCF